MNTNKKWSKLNYAVHPGEILNEYLISEGITQKQLSKKIGINKGIINEIISGKRPITIRTAIKLEKAFSFNAQFWCNLQMIYDEAIERLKCQEEELANTTHIYLSYMSLQNAIISEINYKTTTNFCLIPAAA